MANLKLPYKVPYALKNELVEFAVSTELPFTLHGTQWEKRVINKFLKFDGMDSILAQKVQNFGNFVFDQMKMYNRMTEDYMGYSLMMVQNDGYVQAHRDPKHTENSYWHVRINFLISKPEIGGDPIIENVLYEMNEDDGWFNLASNWTHSCTEVKGNKPRITLSLGHYVDPIEVKNFLKTIIG